MLKYQNHFIAVLPRIGLNTDTQPLYEREHVRSDAIKKAAEELSRVLGHDKAGYWIKTLPEALASILDSYEAPASIAGAIGYLIRKGVFSADQIKAIVKDIRDE